MSSGKWIILGLVFATLTLRADEQFSALKANGQVYSNALVFKVTTTDIYFTSSKGLGNAKLKSLDPVLQKHFHYDPAKASQAEQSQAAATARYEAQKKSQPGSAPSPSGWGVDLPTALNQARVAKKMVLLDFTGSDWCGWCVKFDADVLSTGKFADYAHKLVLVEVDFPQTKAQSAQLKRDNAELRQRFHVDGFPTFVLLNSNGAELGRQVGYLAGGPDAFIAELDRFAKK